MIGMKQETRQKPTVIISHRQILPAVGVKVSACKSTERAVSDDILEAVRSIIANEDKRQPLSDTDVLSRVADQETALTAADIAFARKKLGLGTADERAR